MLLYLSILKRRDILPDLVIARSVATKQPSRSLQSCDWVASSCFAVLAIAVLAGQRLAGTFTLPF